MTRKKIDWDMPIGELRRMDDPLPPPDQLVVGERLTKVTLALKDSSVKFFKREAQRNHTKYQKMIREVLDRYASRYSQAA